MAVWIITLKNLTIYKKLFHPYGKVPLRWKSSRKRPFEAFANYQV